MNEVREKMINKIFLIAIAQPERVSHEWKLQNLEALLEAFADTMAAEALMSARSDELSRQEMLSTAQMLYERADEIVTRLFSEASGEQS